MDRRAALLAISGDLNAALQAADWPALAAAHRALAPALTMLAAQGRWSPPERAALGTLRATHLRCCRMTVQARDLLGHRLRLLRAQRDGWIAYALHSANGRN
jgi:hypothetical protein